MRDPLDRAKFPLALAGLLQRIFEGVVASPLPESLAELVRRVKSDKTNDRKGTNPSRRVVRRVRR